VDFSFIDSALFYLIPLSYNQHHAHSFSFAAIHERLSEGRHSWVVIAWSAPSVDQRYIQRPLSYVGRGIPYSYSWWNTCKGDTGWYWSVVFILFLKVNTIMLTACFSIAAVAPFSGLRWFPQGRRFKQWTGDNLKALMKVSICSCPLFILHKFSYRCISPQLKAMSPRRWCALSVPSLSSATSLDAT